MKPINYLFLAAFVLIGAVIKAPSLAIALPLCFVLVALVVVFYFELEDYKRILSSEKRIEELENNFKLLKSSMNLKNL